jgi:hypothetical protein
MKSKKSKRLACLAPPFTFFSEGGNFAAWPVKFKRRQLKVKKLKCITERSEEAFMLFLQKYIAALPTK